MDDISLSTAILLLLASGLTVLYLGRAADQEEDTDDG